ncbi:hypothetical protein [Streptomyces lateritius]|uniref:hypothetical protein n=1 Tax=Streptomyces lateritius TaxID=67313 RepID=UPI0016761953|nr:hypothetical protein [Streptomyces lateritius]GGT82364.1 hypothetical protein GCM10010272_28630 [Streptomyces lateritius]
MSRETGRETDSSSSGAQGRGGAAYPSGTPPYGTRQYPSLHPTQDGADDAADTAAPPAPQRPEEPKTETTLTTRIRINIPGSRPIPPVVVRKPVAGADTEASPPPSAEAASEPERVAPEPAAPAAAPAEPPKAEEKPTSDWFAPRKSAAPAAPAGPSTPPGAPSGAPSPSRPSGPSGPSGMGAGAAATGAGAGPSAPRRPGGGAPNRGSGFAGPATGGIPTVGGASIAATPAGGTPAYLSTPPQDEAAYGPDGDPYFGGAAPQAPNGPTSGPVTGSSPIGAGPARGGAPGPGPARGGAPGPGAPGGGAPDGGSFGGASFGGAPRMSDDTAVLTPQSPGPAVPPAGPGAPGGGHVSGDTLTSGIPVVPSGPTGAPDFTARPQERFSAPEVMGAEPARAHAAPRPAPSSSAPAKKGRSKLVLLGVGVFGLAGVAYGAGLLLNHSDVPKGTTVLGVDIGGGTKEEAVNKLEAALGKRAHAPLQLSVDGKTVALAPDKAGLSLDSQETVRAAAGSDYNPVSVIGSLFGGERVAEPKLPVDEEKLAVALRDVSGASGSATEGTIVFSPGKVTAVEGKPGKGLDVGRSMIFVRDAYRAQVETGQTKAVELPVVTRQPSITKAELDRAMNAFAKPAMSDLITIKAGTKEIKFGPARSLPKILSMKPVNGRLVEVYDKKAIEELLDGVFDGIMITKGDGKKHQVSADDVAFVMRDALRGRTTAERTKVIDLDGQG